MNFNTVFEIGETQTSEFTVEPEDTADFIGNRDITMLSTPSMIKFMEIAAARIVVKKLPDNYRVVGTKVDIKHINPVPVNEKVMVKATLKAVEGKKLRYEVEVFNNKYKIGFGIYEQHVINVEDFLSKN